MIKNVKLGLTVLLAMFFVSGVFALDTAGTIKSAMTDIDYAMKIMTDQGDDYSTRAVQALSNAMASLEKLSGDPVAAAAAQSCHGLAGKAKTALIQKDLQVATILVKSLSQDLKALYDKVMAGTVKPNPEYLFKVWVQGIMTKNADVEAAKAAQMLKFADQNVLEIQITSKNGYGAALAAQVRYTCKYPFNDAVLAEKSISTVSIDGIWGGDSFAKISNQIQILKCADVIVLNVIPTSHNGYGKICSAQIWTITKAKYDAIMKK